MLPCKTHRKSRLAKKVSLEEIHVLRPLQHFWVSALLKTILWHFSSIIQFTVKREKKMGDRGRDMQQRSQTGFKSKMLLLYTANTQLICKTVKKGPLNPTLLLSLSESVHNTAEQHDFADNHIHNSFCLLLLMNLSSWDHQSINMS